MSPFIHWTFFRLLLGYQMRFSTPDFHHDAVPRTDLWEAGCPPPERMVSTSGPVHLLGGGVVLCSVQHLALHPRVVFAWRPHVVVPSRRPERSAGVSLGRGMPLFLLRLTTIPELKAIKSHAGSFLSSRTPRGMGQRQGRPVCDLHNEKTVSHGHRPLWFKWTLRTCAEGPAVDSGQDAAAGLESKYLTLLKTGD